MAIAISHILFVEKELIRRLFKHRPWRRGALGTKVWTHDNFDAVVTVRSIDVPPGPLDPTDIDEYFRKLQKFLEDLVKRHPVSDLVFQGGGPIAIPDWFHNWCKSQNIDVYVVDDRNVKEVSAAVGRRRARPQAC